VGNIRVEFTSNSATASIIKQIGATSTPVGTFTTAVATTPKWVRVKVVGSTVNVRVWSDGTAEPTAWTATSTTASGVTTAGVPMVDVARTSGTNSVTIDNYRHTDPAGTLAPVVTYGYNTDSQVTTETLIGGSRTRTYTLGRLANFVEALPGLNLTTGRTYDTTGRVGTETTAGVVTTYGYDLASQLTSASPAGGTASSWTYDQNGYRATETIGASATRYLRDIGGQLCWTTTGTMPATPACGTPPSGATVYGHGSSGRLQTETVDANNKVTYTYDRVGRLATAQRVSAGVTTTQTRSYNVLDQLVGTSNTGGTTTAATYYWDPTTPAAQLVSMVTGNATTDLAGGPAGWATARAGVSMAVGQDIYGSTVPTSSLATLARSATYTTFGTPTLTNVFDPKLGYRRELQLDNQVHLRARSYQPGLGQLLTPDPAPGQPGTTTLSNSYTYANNSPLNTVDPLGLFGLNDNIGGTGLSGGSPGGNGPGSPTPMLALDPGGYGQPTLWVTLATATGAGAKAASTVVSAVGAGPVTVGVGIVVGGVVLFPEKAGPDQDTEERCMENPYSCIQVFRVMSFDSSGAPEIGTKFGMLGKRAARENPKTQELIAEEEALSTWFSPADMVAVTGRGALPKDWDEGTKKNTKMYAITLSDAMEEGVNVRVDVPPYPFGHVSFLATNAQLAATQRHWRAIEPNSLPVG
jgi:RHS repeat-associated protein